MTTANIGKPENLNIADLNNFHANPRLGDVEAIAASLQANGQYKPIVVNRGTYTNRPMEVLAGNHTLKAMRLLTEREPDNPRFTEVACWVVDVDDDRANRIVLADNRTADLGTYEVNTLKELLGSLENDFDGTGYISDDVEKLLELPDDTDSIAAAFLEPDDYPHEEETPGDLTAADEEVNAEPEPPAKSLADRYIVPPFTVLDARQGAWQKRKKAWLALGIASFEGRKEKLIFKAPQVNYTNWYQIAGEAKKINPDISVAEIQEQYAHKLIATTQATGTSVFDPVLAEILYTWFSAEEDRVLDPWAGGSVRGIVATTKGRAYVGHELRAEQVQENEKQWEKITKTTAVDDSAALDNVVDDRPEMSISNAAITPATQEAVALYNATSSTPLREDYSASLPPELHAYLTEIYRAHKQEFSAESDTSETKPWAPMHDSTLNCWVAFTGGKDSVAAALQAEEDGMTPVLYHLAGLNRGMNDELSYAAKIAAQRGWRLVVERVSISGSKQGVVELSTKNQVTALFMLSRMASEGDNKWSAGWHTEDSQETRTVGYDYSDGVEVIALFGKYLDKRFPGNVYMGRLRNTTEAWGEVANAGLLRFVKGCVCQPRFKNRVREANTKKFGDLLEGRCGSCVKCAWEQIALEKLGLSESRPEYTEHLKKWIKEAWPDSPVQETIEWLVPESDVREFRRDSWPEQIDPATVVNAGVDEGAATVLSPPHAEGGKPEWVIGDSRVTMASHMAESFDFIIGCPPYYDLEEYSDDEDDLSNMSTEEFDLAMRQTLEAADRCLKNNRFAAFVVGSARDKNADLRDMKSCMINAAPDSWKLANDAVLLTQYGTTAIRASNGFNKGRSLGRVHQDILIFVKGDRKTAARRLPVVDVSESEVVD